MNHSLQRGVTLVELIVVITLLALLATTATPSLSGLLERQDRRAVLNDLFHGLNMARTEAVSRATRVTVCPLDSDNECGGDWNQQVHVFLDPRNQRALKDESNLLRIMEAPSRGTREIRVGNRGFLQFAASGMVHGTLGNITYCPNSGVPEHAGQVIVNMGGRARLAKDHNGDGVVQGASGDPVSCSS